IMVLNARRVQLPGSGDSTALLAIDDLTRRKVAERALKSSEEKYRNLVTSAFDGIIVVNSKGIIEFANAQVEKRFGYTPGELLNQPYDVLITDRDRPGHRELHDRYMLKPEQREMGRGLNLVGKCKD